VKQTFLKHPAPVQIALFSGGDLSGWERWRVSRHVSRCSECRAEVASLRDSASELRALADDTADLPRSLNWNRLAEEITGNIRVGLAAGEAIAEFDRPRRSTSRMAWLRPGWNAGLVAVGAIIIFAVAFWTSLPPQQAEHLMASLNRIRTERIGTLIHPGSATAGNAEDVVLEASSSGIQVRENGRAMSLIPRSDGATVSVSMHGSAGVRYVDADTGQVTTNKVYYAEQ
jgi:anti-sigma factor RsiW